MRTVEDGERGKMAGREVMYTEGDGGYSCQNSTPKCVTITEYELKINRNSFKEQQWE
jgi:hypothetical protein